MTRYIWWAFNVMRNGCPYTEEGEMLVNQNGTDVLESARVRICKQYNLTVQESMRSLTLIEMAPAWMDA